MKAEIIDSNIVLFPQSFTEKFAIEMFLDTFKSSFVDSCIEMDYKDMLDEEA